MKWFWIFLMLPAWAYSASPTKGEYNKEPDIREEFSNAYNTLQDKQFSSFTSTPTVTLVADKNLVVISTPGSLTVMLVLKANGTFYFFRGATQQ